jgi:hypothetical protein
MLIAELRVLDYAQDCEKRHSLLEFSAFFGSLCKARSARGIKLLIQVTVRRFEAKHERSNAEINIDTNEEQ